LDLASPAGSWGLIQAGFDMHRVLLIEASATKRRALTVQLMPGGFEIVPAASFEAALNLMLELKTSLTFAAVVAGWPEFSDARAAAFLTLLDSAEHVSLPTLLLADSTVPTAVNWLMQRPNTALLLWSDYSECVDALKKLLSTRSDSLASPDLIAPERHLKVLFVDDSPTVRVAFRRLLMKQGYVVDTASNAQEGFERALAGSYDIAIVDYFMPEQNGDALVRKLKLNPKTQGLQVAVITGTYSDRVISDSLAAGATECVFKNEAKELFLARISSLARTVTDRQSVDNERKRLEGILRSVGDGVYGVDRHGRITFANPAARDMLGIPHDGEMEGLSAYQLFHHAFEDGTAMPKANCFLSNCYRDGSQLIAWQTCFWHEAGRPVPVEATVYPLEIDGRREGSVVAFRDVSARKLLEEELRWQATHDSLTKLLNRAYFETQLDQEIHRLRRSDQTSALLFVDVDRFKYINDTAGHAAGDQLLIEVSHRLRGRLRAADTLARIGGDEYAVILRNIPPAQLLQTADDFRRVLVSRPFTYGAKSYRVSCTIGVATLDRNTSSPSDAMANADIACHIAKNQGRNQTHLFSLQTDQRHAMDVELGWSARLETAINEDGFVLAFQPIMSARAFDLSHLPEHEGVLWSERQPAGRERFEVLIRMRDQSGELIAPDVFLPTAERFNMMVEVDKWVIRRAFRAYGEQVLMGKQVEFSINLSGQSVAAPAMIAFISGALVEFKVDPAHIIFEINESKAVTHISAAQDLIRELRALGCRFALDDFGSGFCSFSHLKHLHVDYLKIDGAVSQGVLTDSVDRAVISAINDIAHQLGKQTVAEYVDSPAVLRALRECGCDHFQGYYICRPQQIVPSQHRSGALV